ncbi:MAG: aspartate--tRNA ligase [Candidatus Caldatribacteriaceae bacterium]
MLRTHTCGELRKKDVGREVVLAGWVNRIRDHGGILFIDLRDRFGITQILLDSSSQEVVSESTRIRPEYVVQVQGIVRARPEGLVNPKLSTGEIEVETKKLNIISPADLPPFEIEGKKEIDEALRLQYRYLDLRRRKMQENLILRHKAAQSIRQYLSKQGFIEVETPFLTKSTPEGARDFLVPSRLNPGEFYALPQSPQLLKQILMISGLDRYFQIVRCFRDEDLRSDRQPEFTQVDIEMSFVEIPDILHLTEQMMVVLFQEVLGKEVQIPFPVLSYHEAMEKYGVDKPDLRIPLVIDDFTELFREELFPPKKERETRVKVLFVSNGETLSRKKLDTFAQEAKRKNLYFSWIKGSLSDWHSPLKGKLQESTLQHIFARYPFQNNSFLLLAAGQKTTLQEFMGQVRLQVGREWMHPQDFRFCWVVDFPLLEWNDEEKRWKSVHHPFTSPKEEDLPFLEKDPASVRAKAYDVVLNGYEIGGGSIRIHDFLLQEKIFRLLKLGDQDVQEKFGFFVKALRYGCPPHGGIALGFDRLVMLMCGEESIREVIAFPKTQKGLCLLTGAPSPVEEEQLQILGIHTVQRGESREI